MYFVLLECFKDFLEAKFYMQKVVGEKIYFSKQLRFFIVNSNWGGRQVRGGVTGGGAGGRNANGHVYLFSPQ